MSGRKKKIRRTPKSIDVDDMMERGEMMVNMESIPPNPPNNNSNNSVTREFHTNEIQQKELLLQQKDAEIQRKDNDWNTYSTKKSYGEGYLNTDSVVINITLLVSVFWTNWIASDNLNSFQIALVILLIMSLCLRLLLYVFLSMLANSKSEQMTTWFTTTGLNNFVTSLAGILVFVTAAVSAVRLKTDVDFVTSSTAANSVNATA